MATGLGGILPGGGGTYGGMLGRPKPKPMPTPQQAYPAAITQAGSDYDKMMGMFKQQYTTQSPEAFSLMESYRKLLGEDEGYTPYKPEKLKYEQSPDVVAAMGQLKELGATGGLSAAEQGELRARGISPIRSVYANAMQDLERQKSLSGGYAPGAGAAQSRMARELSESIAGQTSNVNATIAEMVQKGKLAAAPQYASFAGSEGAAARDVASKNVGYGLNAAQLNQAAKSMGMQKKLGALSGMAGLTGAGMDQKMKALQGMLSLYGTTPALAQLFGNQVMQQGQLQQQGGLGLIQALMQGIR